MSSGPILSLIISLLSIVGLGASAIIWHQSLPVPWWTIPLVAIIVWYFGLTAGLAWERSRGASVAIGPVVFDEPSKTFYLRLKNGDIEATFDVQINYIINSAGRPFALSPKWVSPHLTNQNAFCREREERHYLICKLATSPKNNPTLTIGVQRSDATGRTWGDDDSVSLDVPLKEQTEVCFHMLVTSQSHQFGQAPKRTTKEITIRFTPDLDSVSCYKAEC